MTATTAQLREAFWKYAVADQGTDAMWGPDELWEEAEIVAAAIADGETSLDADAEMSARGEDLDRLQEDVARSVGVVVNRSDDGLVDARWSI